MKKTKFEGDQATHWIRLKAASAASGIPWETLRYAAREGRIRSRRARSKRNKPKLIIIWVDPASVAAFKKGWRPHPHKPKAPPPAKAKVNHRPKAPRALESPHGNGKA